MRHSKNDAFVFRNNWVNGCPAHAAKKPSAKFSPHNDIVLNVYILKLSLATEVLPDEILSVNSVVAHVELHDFGN